MNNFPSYYPNPYGMQNTTPYGYQMDVDDSQQQMMPNPTMPPLYPSMMTPQFNPPSPFPNYNLAQQRYAKGGSVGHPGLAYLAELLRSAGQRQDGVLAHINPDEARELGQKYGGDINPITGLPQYGMFSKLGKKIGKVGKHVLPLAAGVGGSLLAPSIGIPAMLGGGLGGGLAGGLLNKKKPVQGGILGGLAGALAGPILGGGLKGLMSGTGLMSGLSQGYGSVGSELGGLSGMLGLGGAAEPSQGGGSIANGASSSGASSLGGSGMSSLLDKALLGAAVFGTLGRKEKDRFAKEKFLTPEAVQNLSYRPEWSPKDQPRSFTPLQRILREQEEAYRPGYDPEELYFNYAPGRPINYKEGGYVEGGSPGQADDVDALLPHGSYIIDANTIAQTGDGNSKAGALRWDQFLNKNQNNGSHMQCLNKGGRPNMEPMIKAKISEGEYRIEPHEVTALGEGSNEKGSKILKQMVSNIRTHKGFKGFPPKAKSLENYMKIRMGGK